LRSWPHDAGDRLRGTAVRVNSASAGENVPDYNKESDLEIIDDQ